MGISDAPFLFKLALPFSALAFVLHIIGYSTNSWQATKVGDSLVKESGLWNNCEWVIRRGCVSNQIPGNSNIRDELRSVRAFSTISLIMLIALTVALCISLCIDFFRKKLFILLEMATAFAAGVLIVVAVVIYGTTIIPANRPAEASWSLGLSVAGAAMSLVAGVLIAIGGCSKSSDKKDKKKDKKDKKDKK